MGDEKELDLRSKMEDSLKGLKSEEAKLNQSLAQLSALITNTRLEAERVKAKRELLEEVLSDQETPEPPNPPDESDSEATPED